MGTSYIPKDQVFTVCTNQLNSDPRKLSHSRKETTVFYKNTKQIVLTKDDRNLNKEFTCKAPWNLAASLLAFGAGLIVGALLLSNPIGWIIVGAAIVAIGAVAAVVAVTHKCTDPLNGGSWELVHSTVKINGSIAITRSSILKCSKGGVLTPFFSYSAASKAASDIAANNRTELAINTVSSFFAGVTLPAAVTGITSVSAGAMFAGKMVAGYVFFTTAAWAERGVIRGYNENIGGLKDNETYENINNVDTNDWQPNPVVSKPDDLFQDVMDLKNFIEAFKAGQFIIPNKELASRLSALDGLSRQQLRHSPEANALLRDLKAGIYPGVRNQMGQITANRMNRTTADNARTANAQDYKNNLKSAAKSVGNGILFLLPFVATWFSENARSALAEAMVMDMANVGASLTATTPID